MDTANNVVSDAWKVAYTTAADEDDAVLLEVVALAANVGNDLLAR